MNNREHGHHHDQKRGRVVAAKNGTFIYPTSADCPPAKTSVEVRRDSVLNQYTDCRKRGGVASRLLVNADGCRMASSSNNCGVSKESFIHVDPRAIELRHPTGANIIIDGESTRVHHHEKQITTVGDDNSSYQYKKSITPQGVVELLAPTTPTTFRTTTLSLPNIDILRSCCTVCTSLLQVRGGREDRGETTIITERNSGLIANHRTVIRSDPAGILSTIATADLNVTDIDGNTSSISATTGNDIGLSMKPKTPITYKMTDSVETKVDILFKTFTEMGLLTLEQP